MATKLLSNYELYTRCWSVLRSGFVLVPSEAVPVFVLLLRPRGVLHVLSGQQPIHQFLFNEYLE